MPYENNEERLRALVTEHAQSIFALVLYLIGGNQDRAYEIATSSFTEALNLTSCLKQDNTFLKQVLSTAIKKCREIKIAPDYEEIELAGISENEKKNLKIILAALQKTPFEAKVLLLLRNQLHLPYKDISAIMDISKGNAKIQTEQARYKLRKGIEEILGQSGEQRL